MESEKSGLRYVSAGEVYFNAVLLVEDTGENSKVAAEAIAEYEAGNNDETGRRRKVQCMVVAEDGTKVYLIQMYGDGAPSTYWITFVDANGQHTYSNPGIDCNSVREGI